MRAQIVLIDPPVGFDTVHTIEVTDEDAIHREDAGGWVIVEAADGQVFYFPRHTVYAVVLESPDGGRAE